jgi:hypothetical protein
MEDRRYGVVLKRDDRALEPADEHVELGPEEGCVPASGECPERQVREHLGRGGLGRLACPTEAP